MSKRLVFALYLNVQNVPSEAIGDMADRYRKSFKEEIRRDDIIFVIPTTSGDTKIVLVNKDILVTDDKLKLELKKEYKRIEKLLDDRLKN